MMERQPEDVPMRVHDNAHEEFTLLHSTRIRDEFLASLDGRPDARTTLEQHVRLLTRDGLMASQPIERLIISLKRTVAGPDAHAPSRTSSVSQDPHVELLESIVKWALDEYFAKSAIQPDHTGQLAGT
jgi:hypothetical protein